MERDTPPPCGEVVIDCQDVQGEATFLVDHAGFRFERVLPTDDPEWMVVVGHGLRLALRRAAHATPVTLRLPQPPPGAPQPTETPEGTQLHWVEPVGPLVLPDLEPALVISQADHPDHGWHLGRAGMDYRDLLPGRLGGRFVASHIRVPGGGPVPDHVHHHRIDVQVILGLRGWVDVLYEDQGPALRLHPGEAFLQPPGMRHRVVACSPGMEVLEVACPARHDTRFDHGLVLPNAATGADRTWAGQRFVHARAPHAPTPWRQPGIAASALGLHGPSAGRLEAWQLTVSPHPGPGCAHDHELSLLFVQTGHVTLQAGDHRHALRAGDAATIPAGLDHRLSGASDDLQLWELRVDPVSGA